MRKVLLLTGLFCLFSAPLLLSLPQLASAEQLDTRALRKLARAKKSDKAANFAKVCATVKNMSGSEFLYKAEISGHIPGSDARASGPTLICNRVCPPRFPVSLFYSDGSLATRLGYYGTWNVTGRPRAYCAAGGVPACSNSNISRSSRGKGRDGKGYLQVSRATTGKNTVCYKIPNLLGRNGSPT